jgi:hypothetical protein
MGKIEDIMRKLAVTSSSIFCAIEAAFRGEHSDVLQRQSNEANQVTPSKTVPLCAI